VAVFARSALIRARPEDRLGNFVVLGALTVWMIYTRFFWALHQAHATLPPCPFLRLTGHPCPFCGGSRSFAEMWRGHVAHAAQLYPLGPALFVMTLVAIPALAIILVVGRDLRIPRPLVVVGGSVGVVALAVSWTLKLTVLPN
jgi:hypothetical protein